MRCGEKALWKTILLQAPGEAASGACGTNGAAAATAPNMSRAERLAALYRFQNGEAPPGGHFYDPQHQAEVTDPGQIDWTHFPMIDALEAVTRDELQRLRSLLHAEATFVSASASAPASAPTPPNGLVWGVDLRRAPFTEA